MYSKFSQTKHQRLHALWRQLRVLVAVQVARRTEEAFTGDRQVALSYLTASPIAA